MKNIIANQPTKESSVTWHYGDFFKNAWYQISVINMGRTLDYTGKFVGTILKFLGFTTSNPT